jgi:predicted ribosome quality control (RQC) complex YloA/Tae2 family protein
VEGLRLAAALRPLLARVPIARLPWRFPDADTLVLPLVPRDAVWVDLRLPHPRLAVRPDAPSTGGPATPFQAMLAARAVGPLVAVEQAALDRRATFRFGAAEGFVPVPAVDLVLELTGRHGNAILVDPEGTVLGAWREVGADVNRYRQVRPGVAYVPPPPYAKLDPRAADPAVVRAVLRGHPLAHAHRRVDGIGPLGTALWAARAGVDPAVPLVGEALEAAVAALPELVASPEGDAPAPDLEAARRTSRRAAWTARVEKVLGARATLLDRRLEDAARAAEADAEAQRLRAEADVLLAHARSVPRGARTVVLPGFDGEPWTLALDPALTAVANAEKRYDRARRRAARAVRAREQRDAVEREAGELAARRANLSALDDDALERLAQTLDPPRAKAARRLPGLRVTGPHGFEVVIGRNARENDEVTFRVARSLDVWLHAQGVTGAHVVVRSGGRELPAETLRFAAELAAGHAEVGDEDLVLVDHTLRKHVWKVKGMPAGAVHYAHQRTLAVRPRRRSEVADAAPASDA